MKILLMTWGCDRDDVSEAQIAYRWVREIAKRHDVTLFSVSLPDRLGCVKDQFPEVTVIEWCDIVVPKKMERFRSIVKPGYFLYFNRIRAFLKKLVQENDFDLIHHLNPFAWRYASPAYGLGLPLVRGPVAGGLFTPEPLLKEVKEFLHPYKFLRITDGWRKKCDITLRKSYQATDVVLIAAPYVKDLLKPLPVRRLEIEIELGLDEVIKKEFLQKTRSANRKLELLYVGRIIRTKGLQDAIRAISYMKNKDIVSFTIIGDGEDLRRCRQLARDLRIADTINFRGWCKKNEIEQAYKDADIFVFPSFREPTGGVLLEAMSFGLPCVICDYGGPAYIVEDDCGLKVLPDNSIQFARNIAVAIDNLVDDNTLRLKLGENAYRRAVNHFLWEKKMINMDRIYTTLQLKT